MLIKYYLKNSLFLTLSTTMPNACHLRQPTSGPCPCSPPLMGFCRCPPPLPDILILVSWNFCVKHRNDQSFHELLLLNNMSSLPYGVKGSTRPCQSHMHLISPLVDGVIFHIRLNIDEGKKVIIECEPATDIDAPAQARRTSIIAYAGHWFGSPTKHATELTRQERER